MRQMNDELLKKGYVIIRGKVSRKYFEERFYGMNASMRLYSAQNERVRTYGISKRKKCVDDI
jgi:hypothetical protein